MNEIIKQLNLKVNDMPEFARNPLNPGRFNTEQTSKLAGKTVSFNVKSNDIDFPKETITMDVKFAMDWNGVLHITGMRHDTKAMDTFGANEMLWQKNAAGKFVRIEIVEDRQPSLF